MGVPDGNSLCFTNILFWIPVLEVPEVQHCIDGEDERYCMFDGLCTSLAPRLWASLLLSHWLARAPWSLITSARNSLTARRSFGGMELSLAVSTMVPSAIAKARLFNYLSIKPWRSARGPEAFVATLPPIRQILADEGSAAF